MTVIEILTICFQALAGGPSRSVVLLDRSAGKLLVIRVVAFKGVVLDDADWRSGHSKAGPTAPHSRMLFMKSQQVSNESLTLGRDTMTLSSDQTQP